MPDESVPMTESVEAQILRLNQRLLDAIAAADWGTYEELCDPELTAFEPEARSQRVEGLEFHDVWLSLPKFSFESGLGLWSGRFVIATRFS